MDLYHKDSYLREFDSTVESVSGGKYIVLEDTIFYPNSGGQPHDTGTLSSSGETYDVAYVGRFNGKISHEVDKPGLKTGDVVSGKIDWERRHALMRSHTAGHILSSIINKEAGAEITGNQIGLEKTRIDFNLEEFDRERIKDFENQANNIISRNLPVEVKILFREQALEIPSVFRLAKGFPEDINEIRVVSIDGVDAQACAGTHVKNTSEIGGIEVVKAENKGRNNRRIYFKLGE